MSAMLRSPLYRAALMPPVCLPSAFLEVGVVVLSVPVGPPDAAHDILGQSTSDDTPRSRSFPVILQSADASRRCETGIVRIDVKKSVVKRSPFTGVACHTLPILLLVASPWGKCLRRLGIGLIWRARDKVPDTLGTSQWRCDSIINGGGHMSAGRSPSYGEVLIPPGALPAAHARVGASCFLSHGLGSALALTASVWPLYEAINIREQEGERGSSPLRWPAAQSITPRRLHMVSFNSC